MITNTHSQSETRRSVTGSREKECQMPESAATTVEKIAAFVVGCDNQSVSPEVRDTIGKHLLDSIGCAIGAIGAKTTLHIKSVVDSFGGKPTCTLIGGGQSSPDRAALYNGCLVRYLDFMDVAIFGRTR